MGEKNLLNLTKDIRVLYVEDNKTLRKKNMTLFKELFFDIEEADNGITGLEKYKNALSYIPYDLIISDIKMPGMDGIVMSKKILELNPDQTILIFSAYKEPDLLLDLMQLGITHFIQEPIQLDEFKQKLEKVCTEIFNKKKDSLIKNEYFTYIQSKKERSEEKALKVLSEVLVQNDGFSLDYDVK